MIEGYVQLSRKFFGNFLWEESRVFSRAEAWLDLIQSAAFRNTKRIIDGSAIEVPRGGIVASERFLSDRWQWSRTKVRAFLDLLEAEGMIRREKNHAATVVILCRYDDYNAIRDQQRTTEEPPRDHSKTKEEKGEEGKSAVRHSGRAAASAEEVLRYGQSLNPSSSMPEKPDESFCLWWFDEQEKRGWSDPESGRPWSDWKAAFRAAWRGRCHNKQERNSTQKSYGHRQPVRTVADRERDRTGLQETAIPFKEL